MEKTIFALMALLLVGAGCRSTTTRTEITTFEQCAAAGNAIMESYPRQCRANSKLFVEIVAIPPTLPKKDVAFQYGQDITLGVNDTASFTDGLRARLTAINDSRCKPDVVCIWAGELGATLTVHVGDGASQEVMLGTTTKPMASALGHDFKLVAATETSATISVTIQATK